MSKEEFSKELEEFIPLEEFKGKLKVEFMGMKVKVKFVGTPAINKDQTIGKIGMAPEQGSQTVIFYSKEEDNGEIITTSGDNEGEVSTKTQTIVMLNSSATLAEIYQKHLSLIQGRTLETLEQFHKTAKKIPEDMMKIFMKQMNELGELISEGMDKLVDGVEDVFKDPQKELPDGE